MGATTQIAWCDSTWNPWHGCRKVSQGCSQCYMYRDKKRYGQDPTQVVRAQHATFTVPLRWERAAAKTGKSHRVFTCSWSDFFIKEADSWRDEAMVIMALTPHLTYQVLTKRPERMLAYLTPWRGSPPPSPDLAMQYWRDRLETKAYRMFGEKGECAVANAISGCLAAGHNVGWPFQHVWLGVSVEDQVTAEERIPLLLQTPAAKHFISYEPALESVNFANLLTPDGYCNMLTGLFASKDGCQPPLDWVIIGGESGPKGRPFDLAWARQTIAQCRAATVPVFVKQLGACPMEEGRVVPLRHRAGTDPLEWPPDLRLQEFPA